MSALQEILIRCCKLNFSCFIPMPATTRERIQNVGTYPNCFQIRWCLIDRWYLIDKWYLIVVDQEKKCLFERQYLFERWYLIAKIGSKLVDCVFPSRCLWQNLVRKKLFRILCELKLFTFSTTPTTEEVLRITNHLEAFDDSGRNDGDCLNFPYC